MLKCRLRILMEEKRQRTGQRVTYRGISRATGISPNTLSALAQPELPKLVGISVIDRLCDYFDCDVGDLFVHVKDQDEPYASVGANNIAVTG